MGRFDEQLKSPNLTPEQRATLEKMNGMPDAEVDQILYKGVTPAPKFKVEKSKKEHPYSKQCYCNNYHCAGDCGPEDAL